LKCFDEGPSYQEKWRKFSPCCSWNHPPSVLMRN